MRRGTRRSVPPWSSRRGLLNCRRHGYPHRLEHLATTPLDLAPQQEPLTVLLHLHHLQPVQVTDYIGPLQLVAPLLQPGLEFLTQDQGQERAKDMTPDRLVTPVEDGAGLQQRLARAEPVLHHPQLFVLQRHLGRVEIGVGPQYPLAIVTGVLGDLRLIDAEVSGVTAAEVTAITLVAD